MTTTNTTRCRCLDGAGMYMDEQAQPQPCPGHHDARDLAVTLNRKRGAYYMAGSVQADRPLTRDDAEQERLYDEACAASEAAAELRAEQWFEDRGYDDALAQEHYEAQMGVWA